MEPQPEPAEEAEPPVDAGATETTTEKKRGGASAWGLLRCVCVVSGWDRGGIWAGDVCEKVDLFCREGWALRGALGLVALGAEMKRSLCVCAERERRARRQGGKGRRNSVSGESGLQNLVRAAAPRPHAIHARSFTHSHALTFGCVAQEPEVVAEHPKSEEEILAIREVISQCFLFAHLDDSTLKRTALAMFKVRAREVLRAGRVRHAAQHHESGGSRR